eukprot:2925842-Amphidinium_carterae.2
MRDDWLTCAAVQYSSRGWLGRGDDLDFVATLGHDHNAVKLDPGIGLVCAQNFSGSLSMALCLALLSGSPCCGWG